jgi:DnaJ-class molecular chaperone
MAHECPECGLTCHCNGDIDDILLPDAGYAAMCEHCDHNDEDADYYDDPLECPRCSGSGVLPNETTEYRECPKCNGTGEL